jgi:hypothetical protein
VLTEGGYHTLLHNSDAAPIAVPIAAPSANTDDSTTTQWDGLMYVLLIKIQAR